MPWSLPRGPQQEGLCAVEWSYYPHLLLFVPWGRGWLETGCPFVSVGFTAGLPAHRVLWDNSITWVGGWGGQFGSVKNLCPDLLHEPCIVAQKAEENASVLPCPCLQTVVGPSCALPRLHARRPACLPRGPSGGGVGVGAAGSRHDVRKQVREGRPSPVDYSGACESLAASVCRGRDGCIHPQVSKEARFPAG